MPKFSVIVPTHNGADRLDKALRSVCEQTYTDYELIVVCDHCEDNSAEVAGAYGARVIECDYAADGLARNEGLDAATGEWILFLDDDDWFLHEYVFEQLVEKAGQEDENMLCFAFIWKHMGYVSCRPDSIPTPVWCKCWRRDFIGDMRFVGKTYGADDTFTADALRRHPKVVFWDMPLYYYNYMRKGSLTYNKMGGRIPEREMYLNGKAAT